MTIKRQQHCVNTNRGKLWLIIKNFTFNYITSIANFYSEFFLHIDIKLFCAGHIKSTIKQQFRTITVTWVYSFQFP